MCNTLKQFQDIAKVSTTRSNNNDPCSNLLKIVFGSIGQTMPWLEEENNHASSGSGVLAV